MAAHDNRAGEKVADKILREIRTSDILVVLLTRSGFESAYVQQEIGAAQMAGKLIVPLVGPGIDIAHLAMLQGVEFIDFIPGQSEQARQQLLHRVARLAESKEAQAAILLLAALVVTFLIFSNQKATLAT